MSNTAEVSVPAEIIRGIDGPATLGGLEVAEAISKAGYRKPAVLGYVVVDRDGKFIKDFGQDNVAAQEFAIESSGDCADMGIDWEYRVAEIVETTK